MGREIRRIKLIVAQAKCLKCGFERTLYFTSDDMYGERVVSTKSGKYCAYVNLLNENIMKELEGYCEESFYKRNVNISKNELARIASSIYGITCDDIFDEKIDTMPNTKCVNCNEGVMVENRKYGEQLVEVEVLEVSHNFWESLDKHIKRNKVKKELVRQGYLDNK